MRPPNLTSDSPAGWAEYYMGTLGWSLTPIPRRQKGPIGNSWNRPRSADCPKGYVSDPSLAATVWRSGENMGAVLGPSGLVTIDGDYLEGSRIAFAAAGLDFDTYLTSTIQLEGQPGRAKAIFRAPAGVDLPAVKLKWPARSPGEKAVTVFELRAGAVQDVLPPSIHPDTRKQYRWVLPPWEVSEIPFLPQPMVALWQAWTDYLPGMIAACPWGNATVALDPAGDIPKEVAAAARAYSTDRDENRQEIRRRVPLAGLLEQLGAKQAGGRSYHCPFHPPDDTPSFWTFVGDDGTELWVDAHGDAPVGRPGPSGYCVGDAIDLYMHIHQLSFPEAINRLADELGLKPTAPAPPKKSSGGCHLPEIKVSDRQMRDVSSDCLNALYRANTPPQLFVRSGKLCRIVRDERDQSRIEPVSDDVLRGMLARATDCVRYKMVQDVAVKINVSPPKDIVADILARGEWEFPALQAVIESPVLRPDGTILDQPGYDAATGLYFAPPAGWSMAPVPERPTALDIQIAADLLREIIEDFPFVSDACRANTLALMLTPILRPAIKGPVPLALIDAPRAGNGKSLLGEVVCLIGTGSVAAMVGAPVKDEDWQKLLMSLLLEGTSFIFLDEVPPSLGSRKLSMYLTASVVRDRILGGNQTAAVPQRATWIATGNNIQLGGDLPRRCYSIRIDAATARPWVGREFKHPDLLGWVGENRGKVLAALMTFARNWFVAGRPKPSSLILGKFEDWSVIVGGVLELAGVKGFLVNSDELYDQMDVGASEWEAWLRALKESFGDANWTVSEITKRLDAEEKQDLGETILRVSLPADLTEIYDKSAEGKSRMSFTRRLGRALSAHAGTRYGDDGICLVKGKQDSHKGTATWSISDSAGLAGFVTALRGENSESEVAAYAG